MAIVNDFLYSYQGKSRHSTRLKAIIVKEEFKKLELVHVKIYGARETRSLRSYGKTEQSKNISAIKEMFPRWMEKLDNGFEYICC